LIATYVWKVASVNRVEDSAAMQERVWEEGAERYSRPVGTNVVFEGGATYRGQDEAP
jgi:hypothetical protein